MDAETKTDSPAPAPAPAVHEQVAALLATVAHNSRSPEALAQEALKLVERLKHPQAPSLVIPHSEPVNLNPK
jgi:hypothetical protein